MQGSEIKKNKASDFSKINIAELLISLYSGVPLLYVFCNLEKILIFHQSYAARDD